MAYQDDDAPPLEAREPDVPFASPRLLLQMKESSVREKDRADAVFLRRLVDGQTGLP